MGEVRNRSLEKGNTVVSQHFLLYCNVFKTLLSEHEIVWCNIKAFKRDNLLYTIFLHTIFFTFHDETGVDVGKLCDLCCCTCPGMVECMSNLPCCWICCITVFPNESGAVFSMDDHQSSDMVQETV